MKKNTPTCIGIILDGNRRWAREKGLPTLKGHTEGYRKLKEVMEWAKEAGVKHMVVYAFSTENWNRTTEEVSYLMDLFRTIVREEVDELSKDGVRIYFAGDVSRFPKDIQEMMHDTEKKTKQHTTYTLTVASSYGGRTELVHAFNNMARDGVTTCDEKTIQNYLWTKDIPDPDMIVRTGGEKRLSNFLTWQGVYSELFFTNTYWPDFGKEEFSAMLEEYGKRERRHGS